MGNICGAPRGSKGDLEGQDIDNKNLNRSKKGVSSIITYNVKDAAGQ